MRDIKNLIVQFPADDYDYIKQMLRDRGTTVSAYVRRFVYADLELGPSPIDQAKRRQGPADVEPEQEGQP